MLFDRYHGLGNDYLVLVEGAPLHASLVRAVCDRSTGLGADGVLEPRPPHEGALGVCIWNPDGSTAEKSGNGLRIFAQWLVDEGRAASPFYLWTGACRVGCEVHPHEVVLTMGRATVVPEEVPVRGATPRVDAQVVGTRTWQVTAIGLGNPHCVVFVEGSPDAVDWRAWGAELEVHPDFPRRTNVQIAQVQGPGKVEVRVWERGAGATQASGSSACAVAAAAVLTGRLEPGAIAVHMPGGTAHVEVSAQLDVVLRAPVERVGRFVVDPRWLDARRRGTFTVGEGAP